MRPLEGKDKKATRLGHQNEKPYLRQYYHDSREGKVPGICLCDVRECGLAMKADRPYVRDSADAIAFEPQGEQYLVGEANESYFDTIKSHPVECKCRSGQGSDGSLSEATRIQKKIANLKGLEDQRRIEKGLAVYMEVTSSQRNLLAELIPKASERIQILHHAFTYGTNKSAFLVGNSRGKVLYGVIVTFDPELLQNYGKALDHLYENGLNRFYEGDVSRLPTSYIKQVLLNDVKLKKKYTIDDFMTEWLIWSELLPTNDKPHRFPVPECNMLIPLDHSLWNSSKGGSDTVTRFTYNCQTIVPIKAPQAVVVARFEMLFSVLFHRTSQAVTGTKQPDIERDTIRTIRERNNKRLPFHKSLNYATMRLLENSKSKPSSQPNSSDGESTIEHIQRAAPRFNQANKKARFDIDHSVLGGTGITGATPLGRGTTKNPRKRSLENLAFRSRCKSCHGFPMRTGRLIQKRGIDNKISLTRGTCDLCGARCAYMCFGCKQVLCFNEDRSEEIKELLQTDPDKINRVAPSLEPFISKRDTPAHWRQVGVVKNQPLYTSMSCFHFVHPKYFVLPAIHENEAESNSDDESSTHLSSITGSTATATSSPTA